MTTSSLSSITSEDFISLSVDLIPLEPNQTKQAHRLSQVAVSEALRWQIYLNALGLFGFEQWLTERSALQVDRQACSLFQPGYAVLLPAVARVQVGDFQICLIAVEGNPDQIEMPRAVVELPELMAHFYVVIEVWEELQMVGLWGFLRQDQLAAMLQNGTMQINPDWTVSLPCSEFDPEPERLLLQLRCLTPTALPLPEIPNREPSQLSDLLPRLVDWQPTQAPLWQQLDWQQAANLFTCPEFINWLVRPHSQRQGQLSYLFQLLTQPAINASRWLNGELDSLAQTLNWVLLPPAGVGFRTSVEAASLILAQLSRLGIAISPDARSSYQDLNWGELKLRLYAVTWTQTSPEGTPEWSLVVVLAAQPEHQLPLGLQLQISDLTGVLVERRLTQFIPDAHLYAWVVGSWHEKFLVTIIHNETSLMLPPFAFTPTI